MNTHIYIYIYIHSSIWVHDVLKLHQKNPRTRATKLGEHTLKNTNKHMYNTEIVIKHLP